MQDLWKFAKTTILGGLLFLLPFAVLVVIVVKAGEIAIKTANPVAELLPYSKAVAIPIVYAAGVVLIALLCFGAGLFARTLNSGKLVAWLEDRVLAQFPPYAMVRNVGRNIAGLEDDTEMKPVLVHGEAGTEIGFLVEPAHNGRAIVYMPGSPNPSSGVVRIVDTARIKGINASMADVLTTLKKSGRGLGAIAGTPPSTS